jgi:hypothetical protein
VNGVLRFRAHKEIVIALCVRLLHVVDCANPVLRVVNPIVEKANKYSRYITLYNFITYFYFVFY